MNLLFINPTHPKTPHISAVRAWRFAEELAKKGHRVVFLCAAPKGEALIDVAAIKTHDWTRPFLISCHSGKAARLDKRQLPAWTRKIITAYRLMARGGRQGDWVESAVHAVESIESYFRPQLVWTTFGMMEAIFAALKVAQTFDCPWILDIKDNWELYVPRGMRRLMVWRTRGAEAITSNAKFMAEKVRRWHHREATIVYSGVDEAFFEPIVAKHVSVPFTINLIGSLYSEKHLKTLLCGIQEWQNMLAKDLGRKVLLRYLGADSVKFESSTRQWAPNVEKEIYGYVPIARMAALCRTATMNAYIAYDATFHHKLLELLACDRPLLVCPFEGTEARALADSVKRPLLEASDTEAVIKYLKRLDQDGSLQEPDECSLEIHNYSWPEQTKRLEHVLLSCMEPKS